SLSVSLVRCCHTFSMCDGIGGNRIRDSGDEHCVWNVTGEAAHHSEIKNQTRPRGISPRGDKLRAAWREHIWRSDARELGSGSPLSAKRMRPRQRVEIGPIEPTRRPPEKIRYQIEVEVVFAEILAHQ